MSTHISPHPAPTRPHRSTNNRMIAGVCGGLAEYARVDPLLVRVVVAVLTVFGGLGILVYGICWLLLPRDDQQYSIGESALHKGRNGGSVLSAVALIAAVAITASVVWHGSFTNFGLLCMVIAAAVFFYKRRDPDDPPPPPGPGDPAQADPAAPAATTVAVPLHDLGSRSMDAINREADRIAAERLAEEDRTLFTPPPPAAPEKPPVQRSFSLITPVVLSALVVLFALSVLASDWLTVREFLAVALGLTGAGVLLSAFVGRAPGLIFFGIPLTGALLVSSMIPMTNGGGYGDYTYRVHNASALQRSYDVNAGNMLVDLSDVDFHGKKTETRIRLGVGRAEITVPENVDVSVNGRVNAGEIRFMGHENNGPHVHVVRSDDGPDGSGGGTLAIRADIGFGQLVVHRAAA